MTTANTYHAQTAKLAARVIENMPLLSGAAMQAWIDNPRGIQAALKAAFDPGVAEAKAETTLLTTTAIIRVPAQKAFVGKASFTLKSKVVKFSYLSRNSWNSSTTWGRKPRKRPTSTSSA